VAFLVGSPLDINNPVPAGHAQFPQFRVIELFASKLATDAVIMGHFRVTIYNFLLIVLQSIYIVIFGFSKLINAFPFFPRKYGEGGPHK